MRPTFFLVGAPKAGTTSLFAWIGAHPDVAVSRIKEPAYFAPEVPVDAATAAHRASWDAYLALFAHATGAHAIGEGSVAYFASPAAAGAIARAVPDARILVMLRDPADRLFAHYSAARLAGVTSAPFADWVARTQSDEAARTPVWGPVWAGRYATHLARFRAHFPDDRVLVLFHDDLSRDPAAVLRRVFAFLGVDPDVAIDTSTRHNVSRVPRWPGLARRLGPFARWWPRREGRLLPSTTDRAHAIALYREEIHRLSGMVDRDLTPWTTISPD